MSEASSSNSSVHPKPYKRKQILMDLGFPINLDNNLFLRSTYLLLVLLPKCMTLFIHALTNFSLCGINQVVFT